MILYLQVVIEVKEIKFMLKTRFKAWLPMVLCCVPAVVIAVIVGLGVAVGGVTLGTAASSSWRLGLIMLALLACPLHMGWMMWRMQRQNGASGQLSIGAAACCPPAKQIAAAETDALERVEVLRRRREALEQEVALLLQTPQTQTVVE